MAEAHAHDHFVLDHNTGFSTPSVISTHSLNVIAEPQVTQNAPPPIHHSLHGPDTIYIRHPVEVDTIVSLEQCSVCSTYSEAPARPIPHPDLNRMICKVLDVTPEMTFYKQYVAMCVNCTNLLRKFDRLRVELEFVKTQLVTYVMESLTQVRGDGGSALDGLKSQILDRWTSGPREQKRKGKGKEGYSAAGNDGDLSWAACNNVMKNSTVVLPSKNWSNIKPNLDSTDADPSPSSGNVEYASVNNEDGIGDTHGMDDDLLHANVSDNDNDFLPENEPDRKMVVNSASKFSSANAAASSSDIKPKKKKKKKKRKSTSEGVSPLICTNCGRVFTQRVQYNGHRHGCTSDDLGMAKDCTICAEKHNISWTFETWTDLKNHVAAEHPIVKVESCVVCHIMFLPHGLKRHTCLQPYGAGVNIEAIFKCDRCEKAYNSRSNLVDHVRRIHKDEKHKCDVCDKVYGSPMLLGFHMKRHKTVVSKFRCETCGVCLTTNYGLKEHMKRHTGEQANACEKCGKRFATLSALRCHRKTHENKYPEVCHICGRGFKLKCVAARHIARHAIAETNLTKKCPLCPKEKFRKMWLLKKHMEIEHPGTPEQEEICEKYKHVDDAPRVAKNMKSTLQDRGLEPLSRLQRKRKGMVVTSSSDSDSSDDEDDDVQVRGTVDDAGEVLEDVKPNVDGGESESEESETSTPAAAATSPSRQSARLMGKSKTAKTMVVLLTKVKDPKSTSEK